MEHHHQPNNPLSSQKHPVIIEIFLLYLPALVMIISVPTS